MSSWAALFVLGGDGSSAKVAKPADHVTITYLVRDSKKLTQAVVNA
jgi:hypothetical protein